LKKQALLLFLFYFLNGSFMYAQTLRTPAGACYETVCAYSELHTDVFSFTAQPAALARSKTASTGIFAERRFMLQELDQITAAMELPVRSGNFGLVLHQQGKTDFRQLQFGLAYGRRLGPKADIGARFNYHTLGITGYGNAAAIGFDIGFVLHLTEKLQAGLLAINPTGARFGKTSPEKLPSVVVAGMGYDASGKFFVRFLMEKEEGRPVNINLGFHYAYTSQWLLRFGISTVTAGIYAGLGFVLDIVRIDVVTNYHPRLGFSPGLLLVHKFKKKS
jgi:hypothetical protein